MSDHETNIRSVCEALTGEIAEIRYPAELRCRQEIDVLGRLDMAVEEVQCIFDEYPDSDAFDRDQADHVYEVYQEIAALALAQMAILRVQHPRVGYDDDE